MSMNATLAPPEQWPLAADPVLAYAEWRMSCASVGAAYRQWSNAPRTDAHLAYAAYTAALDREDAAARVYSRLSKRAMGTDPAAWSWLGRHVKAGRKVAQFRRLKSDPPPRGVPVEN
jgi:hypothetical protein